MRKRQGNLKGSIRTLTIHDLPNDREMGEGWQEGRLPIRPPSVTVTEAQIAAARQARRASERAKRAGVIDTRTYVVVPSTTELELAMAAAAREAARRSAAKAAFAHKVNVARIKRAMSGAL